MATIDSIRIDDEVRAIMFDYGGTLDSRGDHWAQVIRDAYSAAGCEIPLDSFIEAYIHGERTLASNQIIAPTDTFRELMRKKIAIEMQWLADNGFAVENAVAKAIEIADRCYSFAKECVEESAVTLRRLQERYPLALVSNFYGNLHAVIEDFGIADCFTAVIESAVVGVRKPDTEIFRLGLDALGFPANQVLVVGDSLDKDILPAQSIGCHTFQILGRQWFKSPEN